MVQEFIIDKLLYFVKVCVKKYSRLLFFKAERLFLLKKE